MQIDRCGNNYDGGLYDEFFASPLGRVVTHLHTHTHKVTCVLVE